MDISLNKQLDKEVFLDFSGYVAGGVDFGKKIRNEYPNLTKENYIEFIEDFYKKTDFNILELKKCFTEIEDVLFNQLEQYFGYDYSGDEYHCHPSMFDCNPRYIETKTFQVYYKKSSNYKKEVIAHEITHFAFYDFCHKINLNDSNELWELSEIFNVLFLNNSLFRNVLSVEEKLFYPQLENKLAEIRSIWNDNNNASQFISKSLVFLQKK